MRARYYDSAAGRFISRDPVRDISPRNINPYQYALGNPIRYVDPSGKTLEEGRYAASVMAMILGFWDPFYPVISWYPRNPEREREEEMRREDEELWKNSGIESVVGHLQPIVIDAGGGGGPTTHYPRRLTPRTPATSNGDAGTEIESVVLHLQPIDPKALFFGGSRGASGNARPIINFMGDRRAMWKLGQVLTLIFCGPGAVSEDSAVSSDRRWWDRPWWQNFGGLTMHPPAAHIDLGKIEIPF